MKIISMVLLAILISCQDVKESGSKIQKVANSEEELFDKDSIVLVANIQEIEIDGANFRKEEGLNIAEDIKVIEKSSGKVIDDFPLVDWGPVSFINSASSVTVMLDEGLEINYSIKDKKVVRDIKCVFVGPETSKYEHYLKLTKATSPDWEAIYFGIFRLAVAGHKKSYDFFMDPSEDSKKMLAHATSSTSVNSIYRVLTFMKKNGCQW